jgi:hypothetical protein
MLTPDGLKKCPRCSETKLAAGNFYRSGRSADGYAGYCIPCTKAAATVWQKALPEDRRRTKNKADWETFKQLPLEERQRRNKVRAASVANWINRSPENKEQQRAWQRAYKLRDPERRRCMNQIGNNRARAKKLGLPNTFQYVDWVELLEKYVNACAFCGATNALLDMEHLDAMGAGGPNVPGNVVPACRPCNAQKWRKTLTAFCLERNLDERSIRSRAANVG